MPRPGLFIFALLALGVAAAAPAWSKSTPVVRLEGDLDASIRTQMEEDLPRASSLPATLFDARRIATQALDTVLETLTAEGYHAAEAAPDAELVGDAARGVIVIRPGARFLFAPANITFSTPLDPQAEVQVRRAAQIVADTPATGLSVVTAEAAGLAALRGAGYADAAILPRSAEADHAVNRLFITLAFDPGPKALLGALVIDGETATDRALLERLRTWRIGDVYSPQALDDFNRRLIETGVFDAASAHLGEAVDGMRPVVLSLTDRRPRTISLGASASTTEGLGVEAEWRRRNLLGRAETLSLSARAASLEQALGLEISLPHISAVGRTLTIGADLSNRETDAFDLQGVAARISLQEDARSKRFLGVGATLDASRIQDLAGERTFYVGALFAEGRLDRSDDLLDPKRGWRAELRLEPSYAGGDESVGFLRAQGSSAIYRPLSEDISLAARLRLATLGGAPLAAIPADRRFYAGGGGSVRGYEYQSLSPSDARTTRVTGGASLVEASVEVRGRIGPTWGYAAFVDAGAASRRPTPDISDIRAGAGLGLRYYAGFGPIRADIAIPLERRQGEAAFQVYVSLGQAF